MNINQKKLSHLKQNILKKRSISDSKTKEKIMFSNFYPQAPKKIPETSSQDAKLYLIKKKYLKNIKNNATPESSYFSHLKPIANNINFNFHQKNIISSLNSNNKYGLSNIQTKKKDNSINKTFNTYLSPKIINNSIVESYNNLNSINAINNHVLNSSRRKNNKVILYKKHAQLNLNELLYNNGNNYNNNENRNENNSLNKNKSNIFSDDIS